MCFGASVRFRVVSRRLITEHVVLIQSHLEQQPVPLLPARLFPCPSNNLVFFSSFYKAIMGDEYVPVLPYALPCVYVRTRPCRVSCTRRGALIAGKVLLILSDWCLPSEILPRYLTQAAPMITEVNGLKSLAENSRTKWKIPIAED